MSLDGRFTFHGQLGKLRCERFSDPVLVAWRGGQQRCQAYDLVFWLSGLLFWMLDCSSVPENSCFRFQVLRGRREGYLGMLQAGAPETRPHAPPAAPLADC